MKKDLIFAPILLVIGAMLFLYDFIGEPAHIVISILGVFALAVYTSATKKEWKIIPLEIAMRAAYGIALITGIVVMNVEGILPLAIAHKVFGGLFIALLVITFVHKLIVSKKQ